MSTGKGTGRNRPDGPEEVGWVVLWHLDPPYKHAGHCWGWVKDDGDGLAYPNELRLFEHALEAGSKFLVGKRVPGTYSAMKNLRANGNAGKVCKVCRRDRLMKWQDEHLEELLMASVKERV